MLAAAEGAGELAVDEERTPASTAPGPTGSLGISRATGRLDECLLAGAKKQ